MRTVVVISPHPDDETLGCGGTILRHVAEGDSVHWVIVTCVAEELGYTSQAITDRAEEIQRVADFYRFSTVTQLGFLTTRLDVVPRADIIEKLSDVFVEVKPETLYVPYGGDVHSDHVVVADASIACTKSFRFSSVKQVRAYEVLSETEFGISPNVPGVRPNLFIDIGPYLEKKIEVMHLYKGEMGVLPFPRSVEAIRALATVRGTTSGCSSAEAFMTLREIL